MLETYDKQVMDNRDTNVYRHKGKETTTVKAKTGLGIQEIVLELNI